MENIHLDIFNDDTQINIPLDLSIEPPRTEIHDQFYESGTRHEAVVAYGKEYKKLNREPLCNAKKYKFELDFFQKISLCAIERDESVIVSAHTSCGKTVVAEYAIAQSIKNNQRVVYTSPIKALSNQKYRELQEEFTDVGLMTGDVTINPTASCLVMTTEIFRNMLYRGSEIFREVHWVIFDEIHYMKDKERGVVWEETLILLPRHTRLVFLSATIPNALEFAEWICYISGNPIHVVYTEKRVIPLNHYFYSDEMHLIKDTKLHKKNFIKAMKIQIRKTDIGKQICKLLDQINMPAVFFSFSRKDCENFATNVEKDYNGEDEKKLIRTIFENAIGSLCEEDRKIPIIQKMLPLLERGIGIHHSGLLPIIKEIVEILFQESLIKILFATETFSIGLNMPAKTVVFTSLSKFDGIKKRLLTCGEYTQMSGRAGRRGLDEQGISVSIVSDSMLYSDAKKLFSECTDNLYSAFRLTYNMVLNLTRVEGLDPLYMMSRSFYHFQAYKKVLQEEKIILEAIETNRKLCDKMRADRTREEENLYKLLVNRELLYVKRNKELSGKYLKLLENKGRVVDVMVPRSGAPLVIKNMIVKSLKNEIICGFALTNDEIKPVEFPVEYVTEIYNIRCKANIKVFNKKFPAISHNDAFVEEIKQVEGMIRTIVPDINFDHCLFCNNPSWKCLVSCNPSEQENTVLKNAMKLITNMVNEEKFKDKVKNLKCLKEIYHMKECKKMIKVLINLEYLNETSVLIKGKMASEISTGDELVLTELIFGSSFVELPLIDMIALLSCFVCEEKETDGFILSDENSKLYELLKKSVTKVCYAMHDSGIKISLEDYIESFSYQMMDIVKMWISGYTFIEICDNTQIFEGSIIRTFKRLEELLRQLINAAIVIGNNDLVEMFGQGIFLIKRNIVFANSLYL